MKNASFGEALPLAFSGISEAFRSERNLKIDGLCALAVLVLGALFQISVYEWLFVILCIGMVFSLEIVNTAIETVVDLVCPEIHPLAKRAKDCAAGAVLCAALVSVVIGALIFVPHIVSLFA